MKTRATLWLIFQGVALTLTGFLASAGMSFLCVVNGHLDAGKHPLLDIGPNRAPDAVYAAVFVLMIAWIAVALVFAWRNRTSLLGLALAIIAFLVFAFSADQVLKFAYPVCNAF